MKEFSIDGKDGKEKLNFMKCDKNFYKLKKLPGDVNEAPQFYPEPSFELRMQFFHGFKATGSSDQFLYKDTWIKISR
tara:strand:- start:510 stop:740 length:231 start_codon:yes stop_codon:yes gene_type:complete